MCMKTQKIKAVQMHANIPYTSETTKALQRQMKRD